MEIQKLTPVRLRLIEIVAENKTKKGITRAEILAHFDPEDCQKTSAQIHYLVANGLLVKTPQRGIKVDNKKLGELYENIYQLSQKIYELWKSLFMSGQGG